MGEEVAQQEFTREDRTRYREKVRRCLDVFARMLRESRFDADDPMTGMEIELNLVDDVGDPALKNAEALEAIADPDFQTELGQFNLEINVPPKQLKDRGFTAFEEGVRASLNHAETQAAEGRRAHGDDRHPADPVRRPHEPGLAHREPPLPAAVRPDPRRARRGHRHRHRRPRAAAHHLGLDRARGRLHQHPAAHPGQPRELPGLLERLPGDRAACSSRSVRTHRSCSAASCGERPGCRCSSRPPTPAARS